MSKDTGGFLRKVVRFVANPTTDWTALDAPPSDGGESEYAKTEIKAMIERKRRNDFVRKRELDMLRKIRREGLSPDNALALGGSSNLDSDSRPQNGTRSDIAVKAKIDEIEQQMVGVPAQRQATTPTAATTQPAAQPPQLRGSFHGAPESAITAADALTIPATLPAEIDDDQPPQISQAVFDAARAAMPWGRPQEATAPPLIMLPPGADLVHDPELDEAVIAFANADFDQCERCLLTLVHPGGERHEQRDAWLVLLDLYRALDMQHKFEQLSVSYAQHFGVSAPHWYSLPQKVAAFHSAQGAPGAGDSQAHAVSPGTDEGDATEPGLDAALGPQLEGWVAPALIDHEAVAQVRAEVLQLPRPWTMDWSAVANVTVEGAGDLRQLTQQWLKEPVDLVWIGAEHLLEVLSEAAPTGSRDVDPALWMLRLDVLLLCNRAADFDEVAIDYCITYETSPPSWETPACHVRVQSDAILPHTRSLSHVSDVTTSFVESRLHDEVEFVQVAALNLSGQLVGDIGNTLTQLDGQLSSSASLVINCEHLLRVDFIAAGDLLNWVLARRAEGREVTFLSPHRLVAMFFGAMGINEHATVRLQII